MTVDRAHAVNTVGQYLPSPPFGISDTKDLVRRAVDCSAQVLACHDMEMVQAHLALANLAGTHYAGSTVPKPDFGSKGQPEITRKAPPWSDLRPANDNAPRNNNNGTGLGKALLKTLVRRLGGTVVMILWPSDLADGTVNGPIVRDIQDRNLVDLLNHHYALGLDAESEQHMRALIDVYRKLQDGSFDTPDDGSPDEDAAIAELRRRLSASVGGQSEAPKDKSSVKPYADSADAIKRPDDENNPVYHRKVGYDEYLQVSSSGLLYGKAPRLTAGGGDPQVKAYLGALPADDYGYEFTSPIPPTRPKRFMGGSGVVWVEDSPGVIDIDNDTVAIPVKVRKFVGRKR